MFNWFSKWKEESESYFGASVTGEALAMLNGICRRRSLSKLELMRKAFALLAAADKYDYLKMGFVNKEDQLVLEIMVWEEEKS